MTVNDPIAFVTLVSLLVIAAAPGHGFFVPPAFTTTTTDTAWRTIQKRQTRPLPRRIITVTMASPDDTAEGSDNNENDVVEPFLSSFTTNTNKRLVFDGTRFYETNDNDNDDSAQVVVTNRAQSMYVQELPVMNYDPRRYKPTDMIPTEELFGSLSPRSGSRWQLQDGDKNLDLLDLECNQEECDVVDYNQDDDNVSSNDGYDDSLASIPGAFNPNINDVPNPLREAMENAVLACYQAWNARDMQKG